MSRCFVLWLFTQLLHCYKLRCCFFTFLPLFVTFSYHLFITVYHSFKEQQNICMSSRTHNQIVNKAHSSNKLNRIKNYWLIKDVFKTPVERDNALEWQQGGLNPGIYLFCKVSLVIKGPKQIFKNFAYYLAKQVKILYIFLTLRNVNGANSQGCC